MTSLKGTHTHQNLKAAFAGEAQANRCYLYFARLADVEGYPEIAGLFRDTAEGEAGHAHGHLDRLREDGDPVTGMPMGATLANLEDAIAGETPNLPGDGCHRPRTRLSRIRRLVRSPRPRRAQPRRTFPPRHRSRPAPRPRFFRRLTSV